MNTGAIVFFVLQRTVDVLISGLQIAMLLRAIFSWFDPMQEGRISTFLLIVTEPVILPIRALCQKMHWFEGLPLDIPFLLTWILLSVLQTLVISL
ncbi:MAG: YggT family protein [Clostridia bacterium]|nr:YggT family protein [Clostridia bacterium]